ncbi:MAG: ABC transporter permease [Defluviitaleaceae bacterium]|nr:ABC transporter permease [Defluviitaleaceae bacterium]MCL2240381.1 ABC transporter permease [Defluviitaleaceae bacterium]
MKRVLLWAVCALVLAASLILLFALERTAGHFYAEGVVMVTPRISDVRYHIPRARVDALAQHFPAHNIVGVSRSRQVLASDYRSAVGWIYQISPGYFDMYRLDFTQGTAPHRTTDIVLNEELAWQLFGNTVDVVGLEIQLNDAHTVGGIVQMGGETTAWRMATDEPVSTLYIRTEAHDPLASATAVRILRNHLGVNPDDYNIVDIDRVVQSIGIRARILLATVLAVASTLLFLQAWRTLRKHEYVETIMFSLCAGVVTVFFSVILNHILLWLPNPAAINISTLSYIFRPIGPVQLTRLSSFANTALAIGFISMAVLLKPLAGKL